MLDTQVSPSIPYFLIIFHKRLHDYYEMESVYLLFLQHPYIG